MHRLISFIIQWEKISAAARFIRERRDSFSDHPFIYSHAAVDLKLIVLSYSVISSSSKELKVPPCVSPLHHSMGDGKWSSGRKSLLRRFTS